MRNKQLLFLLAAAGMTGMTMSAAHLTPREALQRLNSSPAMAKMPSKFQSVSTPVVSTPAYYIFEGESEGYIVVSADDAAVPLLGYSDSGSFDAESMSPEMKWWLSCYEKEIASAPAQTSKTAGRAAERAAVAPLVATRWNQDSPYNDKCPKVGSTATYTGCVATAMAQVIRYHSWPAKGKGTASYTWNNRTLSFDYANTTFDWANMLDTYGRRATTAQKDAVATLMYACGVGVSMNYGTDESGASTIAIAPALINYFDFDKSLRLEAREIYGISEWEDLIYGELSESRPVIYAGSGTGGGHCFVCDGYQNGYFHFNWGWGGVSDGYFLLSALSPGTQGIGGNASGFNEGQMALVGIRKPVSGSEASAPNFVCTGRVGATLSGNTLEINGGFFSFSATAVSGRFAIRAVNATSGEEKTIYFNQRDTQFNPSSGYYTISVSVSSLANGTWRLYPVFMSGGKEYAVRMTTAQLGYVLLVKGSTSKVSVPMAGEYFVADAALGSQLYWGSDFQMNGTVTNSGATDVVLPIYPVLTTSDGFNGILAIGGAVTAVVPAGGSLPIEYIGNWMRVATQEFPSDAAYVGFVTPGTTIVVNNTPQETYVPISDLVPITLKEAPSQTSIGVSDFIINNGNTYEVTSSDIPFSVTLTCSQGYFGGTVDVAIFPASGGSALTAFTSPTVFVGEGESKTVDFSGAFADAVAGQSYLAAVFYGQTQLCNTVRFKVTSTSGIGRVETDAVNGLTISPNPAETVAVVTASEQIEKVSVYEISGASAQIEAAVDGNSATIDVSALRSGIYIVTVETASGAETAKLIRR